MPSIAFELEPITGTLASTTEIDCYTVPASTGDVLAFAQTGSAQQMALVDAKGIARCTSWGSACTIAGDAPYRLLLSTSPGAATGTYRLTATCRTSPAARVRRP